MPSLTFVLPHWLYWSGLFLFPIFAMIVVRKQHRKTGARKALSLPIGYLLWLGGGFVGLHRYYVKNFWGIGYIPLFLAILYGNVQSRDARELVSKARNELSSGNFLVGRFTKQVEQGRAGAAEKLASAKQSLVQATEQMSVATDTFDFWFTFSGIFAAVIAVLLIVDAYLLPRLVRRCAEKEGDIAPPEVLISSEIEIEGGGVGEDPTRKIETGFTRIFDAISGWSGEFVAYWSIIAVFVYYYEVLARYVFNSPTNWAHESMFLMFGMQYLLAGAYTLREDAHVRVDVIYLLLPARGKVITDIVTSVFFFIFTGALLVTGWIFMADSIDVFEVSFTEWAIQYWPVKITIALGALLILLQGVSKVAKDFCFLARKVA